MSTSILDYTFRELAISYLDRHDLGHVSKDDLDMDTTGGGEAQSELVNNNKPRFIRKQGLVAYSNNGNAAEAVIHDQTVAEDTSIIPATASVVAETSSAYHSNL